MKGDGKMSSMDVAVMMATFCGIMTIGSIFSIMCIIICSIKDYINERRNKK